jgi:segregation and condensation protein B
MNPEPHETESPDRTLPAGEEPMAASPETEASPKAGPASTAAAEESAEERERRVERKVEALLFSCEVPLTTRRLLALTGSGKAEILAAIDRLNVFYGETGRAFRISPLGGGFQVVTLPEHACLLTKLHKERIPTRLSRAALETLSIIAFKQPVTRAEIDAIRGVSASDGVLRHLIERKLARIAGRAEAPGRPLLYGTTREFLAYFGLSNVTDLPRTDELDALLAGEVPASPEPDEVGPGEDGELFPAEHRSHSGEESDDHERAPSP